MHICSKFGLLELVNLICLREVSVNGMVNLGWKKYICVRIQECGRRAWKYGFNDTEREYVRMKEGPKSMVRGGCLHDCRCGLWTCGNKRCMGYLNALYMKKKEKYGEGL